MRKIKIITSTWADQLEEDVNYFITKHPNVIDIQMQYRKPTDDYEKYVVMIVYEED